MSVNSSDAGTGSGFFDVHLASLERFAIELEGQLDALRKPCDRLSVLAGQQLPLGRFAEADALGSRATEAARQMYGLLQAVREAVNFAGEVTRGVAGAYQRFDQQAATRYGAAPPPAPAAAPGSGPATPGSGPATTGAGTVQPVSVGVSVAQPVTVTVNGPNLPSSLPVTVTYTNPAQAPMSTVPVEG